jgi:hypothetical protein
MAADSDCDSGAFSRCSTPGLVFNNAEHCPLISPPLVLSVINQDSTTTDQSHTRRLETNPNLLLSCLREAGKSSIFSSLENLSTNHADRDLVNKSTNAAYRKHLSSLSISTDLCCDVGVMEGVRMRGSLANIYEGRVGGGGRPESSLSWWWDNEFGGEDTDMDKREGEQQESSKTYIGVTEKTSNKCSDNCNSKVTVNGQHICSLT